MSKRAASYDIDQHTYEEKERARDNGQSIDDEGKHLANRKIYKIRKTDDSVPQSSGKVQLKLTANLDNNDRKDTSKDVPLPENPFKFNLFSQSQGVGLFSNILSTPTVPPKAELVIDNASKDSAKETPKQPAASSWLFGPKPTEAKGSIFSAPNTSLFGTGSLFSNSSTSNFLNNNTTGPSFGSTLFGGKITGPISAAADKGEEEEGDSAQLEKDQQMVADPAKSEVKYDYGVQDQYLKKIVVAKYKKDKGSLVENVEAIIKVKTHEEKTTHYLIIRLAATKNIIFTGLIFPHQSAITRNGENIDIRAFEVVPNKLLEPRRIKMQIKGLDKELGQFYNEIQKIIDGKKQE